jgi:hypothetical protein
MSHSKPPLLRSALPGLASLALCSWPAQERR